MSVQKIKIDTHMLIRAFEDHRLDSHYYIDVKTGKIIFLTDEDMENERGIRQSIDADENRYRYIYIESFDRCENFKIMERFVEKLPEGEIKIELYDALSRQNPFRRFKDTLYNYPDIREGWLLFNNNELKKKASMWLQYNNINAELLPIPGEK